MLKKGSTLHHEDEASSVVRACTILHNMFIDAKVDLNDSDCSTNSEIGRFTNPNSDACYAPKKIRKSLLNYVKSKT